MITFSFFVIIFKDQPSLFSPPVRPLFRQTLGASLGAAGEKQGAIFSISSPFSALAHGLQIPPSWDGRPYRFQFCFYLELR